EGFSGPTPPLASFMDGESDDRQLSELSAALAEAERALTEAGQSFAPGAAEVREQLALVRDRTRAIDAYVEARLARARERLGALGHLARRSERELATVERVKGELAELRRDQEAYAETYTRLLEQEGEASLVIARAVSKDRVIDPPRAVAEPASPNFRQALSSVLFGSFAGVLLVLFRRLTAGTVQAENDARLFLGPVPVLGVVPCFEGRPGRPPASREVLRQAGISGHSAFEDAFRLFGMTLFGADAAARQNLVFVTSPGAQDGKTMCALALGLALARRGRRVLVIDGEPVRAHEAARAGARPRPGLADVLAGRATLVSARVGVPAGSGELHSLSRGSVGPGELPAYADQLREFLDLARARYDVVLVDVPGHMSTDMMALVGSCDAVLLVLRLRHTRRQALAELLGALPLGRSVALVVDDRLRASRGGVSRLRPLDKERAVA
ncbi:MAG TPA: GNVR domain-containing protein, partial [Polyangiaceae bacterium]|nr:GNVR domain-containing protein [Polyangiaceae bacterium]